LGDVHQQIFAKIPVGLYEVFPEERSLGSRVLSLLFLVTCGDYHPLTKIHPSDTEIFHIFQTHPDMSEGDTAK